MELKSETVRVINKNYKGRGNSIRMRVHWDKENGQYVLCINNFFSFNYTHFTLEECEDMVKILKRYNNGSAKNNP
jgi:hypothetical protein